MAAVSRRGCEDVSGHQCTTSFARGIRNGEARNPNTPEMDAGPFRPPSPAQCRRVPGRPGPTLMLQGVAAAGNIFWMRARRPSQEALDSAPMTKSWMGMRPRPTVPARLSEAASGAGGRDVLRSLRRPLPATDVVWTDCEQILIDAWSFTWRVQSFAEAEHARGSHTPASQWEFALPGADLTCPSWKTGESPHSRIGTFPPSLWSLLGDSRRDNPWKSSLCS
jgi:hypothetical protein